MTLSFSESPAILKVGSMATYDGYGSPLNRRLQSSQLIELENHAQFCQSHACAHKLKWRMHNYYDHCIAFNVIEASKIKVESRS